MTATDIFADLDARPMMAAAPAPQWRKSLPWTVAGLTSIAALSLLAMLIARPAPAPAAPAPLAQPTQAQPTPADPSINSTSSDGVGTGATVWRDATGTVVGVMTAVSPYGDEAVWCQLTVDGQHVEAAAVDGLPAICVWVRGAE